MPLITPTAYFPPADWFAAALRRGGWTIEAHEHYQRRGWRNRARIGGPNNTLLLSVPLRKGKNQRLPIRDVLLGTQTNWRREHEASIRTAYGRSPFFEFYAEEVFDALHYPADKLYSFNRHLIETLLRLLQLPVRLGETTEFRGASSSEHLPSLSPYPQVFSDRFGYRGGLSILDALFCLGPGFAAQPLDLGGDAGARPEV